MRKIIYTTLVLIIAASALVPALHALDPIQYQALEEIPGITQKTAQGSTTINIVEYLPNLVKLAIGLAAALAVIYLIIGGFQYISTDAIYGKKEGKERINNALLGLFLAISSVVILNTISPKLLNINLSVKPVTPTTTESVLTAGPSTGVLWPSDSIDRANFTSLSNKIAFNRINNCAKIGDVACTSVYNINQVVIDNIGQLARTCNCQVIITGGTEYWLHGNRSTEIDKNDTKHKPGGRVIDLSLTPELGNFLKTNGTNAETSRPNPVCAPGAERYLYGGGLFVNEQISGNPPHWHVCY